MQGHRALLGLVIVMGVLILAGTATLIGVVVHRLAAGHSAVVATAAPVPGQPQAMVATTALLSEPAGTHIQSVARQSDTLLSILLTGGGPDRVLVWDLSANRRLTELSLAP